MPIYEEILLRAVNILFKYLIDDILLFKIIIELHMSIYLIYF